MSRLLERYRLLKEAIEFTLKEANLDGIAGEILTRVVIDTIHVYQQKLNVGIQDSVTDLVDNFKQKVSESIFDSFTGWRVASREPVLFPRGCRFCYTRGLSTVFVIEQDPQIRTLLFSGGMLGDHYTARLDSSAERIALALPYVNFILHFKDNAFCGLYCGWKTSPLRSLDEPLAAPLLPNIHNNLNVCLGLVRREYHGTFTEQTEGVLGEFWNSRFNNDLSSFWWGKNDIDGRLSTARIWSENSLIDSSFILEPNFTYLSDRSVRRLIDLMTMHEEEPDANSLRHKLSESIDSTVESLFSRINKYFKKTKFDKHHPRDIKDALQGIIRNANEELVDIVMAIQVEVNKLEEELQSSKLQNNYEKKGHLWEKYST